MKMKGRKVMAVSLILTEQIIKLFIILLLGFLLVKFGLLKASDSKSVSVILVYLILPCMIINAFQIDYTPQVRTGLIFTSICYCPFDFYCSDSSA